MAKRFTDSAKWQDPWFRRLLPDYKLAWLYLLDNCDAAGVIDLDRDLAIFQIGNTFCWDEFIAATEGRVTILPNGKLWLTKFIAWQYGELSEDCRPHRAVIALCEKHGLDERVLENPERVSEQPERVQEKDKDKDKDKDLEGGVGETKPKPRKPAVEQIPLNFSLPLREKVAEWLRYRGELNKRYKPTGLKNFFGELANVARDEGEHVVVAKLSQAMANGWQGWNHPLTQARGSPGYSREAESAKALKIIEEADRGQPNAHRSDQSLLRDLRPQAGR